MEGQISADAISQEAEQRLAEKVDALGKRLDVVINLLLDIIPENTFAQPRKVSHKIHRLKLTRVALKDADIGRIVGSPGKDVNRRLSEYDSEAVVKRMRARGASSSNDKPNDARKKR